MNSKEFNESPYAYWKFTTELSLFRLEDGDWKITNAVKQERSLDGNTWETEQVQFVSVDKEVEAALSRSWLDTAQYLNALQHDLFSKETTVYM